jgi:hypothetical protein
MRTADSPTVTTTSALSHRVPILVFSWMLRVFKFKSAYYPDVRWSGIHEIWIGGTPVRCCPSEPTRTALRTPLVAMQSPITLLCFLGGTS